MWGHFRPKEEKKRHETVVPLPAGVLQSKFRRDVEDQSKTSMAISLVSDMMMRAELLVHI